MTATGSTPTPQAWKQSIRALYESFQRTDEELKLLRDIDRSIVEQRSSSVEEVFLDSLTRLTKLYGLEQEGRCYLHVGDRLLPLEAEAGAGALAALVTPSLVDAFAASFQEQPVVLRRGEGSDDLFDQFEGVTTILLQPIYEADERLFAVLLFSDGSESAVASPLNDSDLALSVRTVARQLSIAYTHALRAEQEQRSRELWDLIIGSDLPPATCFGLLAEKARGAYPVFGPLRLAEDPEVQILVLEHDKDEAPLFLTIRGTTGAEPVITKIDIDESISGLLVSSSPQELPYFCDDPRRKRYRGKYKSYLGHDGTPIKTEMAVRLVSADGELVGVLNFESAIENAFNLRHQAAIFEFAELVAPMVKSFEERITSDRVTQLSVTSVTSKYLDSLAGIFRHGVASPLVAFKGDVEAARRIIDEKIQPRLAESNGAVPELADGVEKLSEAVNALATEYRQVYEFTREFGSEISGFGDTGKLDLVELIEQTVSLAERSYLSKAENDITITVAGESSADAFCSRLFKQHFFSLLTNSIYSLQEKAEQAPVAGEISVTLKPFTEAEDSQERELNRRWLVSVRDNGVGVDAETMERLEEFKAGGHYRKGSYGMGLGLAAMRGYMSSVGGAIELVSEPGEFFEVRLLFDVYRADVHEPLSILGAGGGNDA